MSWTRRFIWAFWIFVAVMLLWQFYTYNAKISAPPAHPTQDHFFFYQPAPGAAAAPVEHDGPFVEQSSFTVEDHTPSDSSFTCHVTLKNSGKAKAIDVSVCVRPFRGAIMVTDDNGNGNRPISDDSPRAQINQWVSFPDLDPGQSVTESVMFMKDSGATAFGENPRPEIVYQPEKK